jgi:hypothetical protein
VRRQSRLYCPITSSYLKKLIRNSAVKYVVLARAERALLGH